MEPLSVLVSSSPIPSHPSTRIVSETIHSIRWHFKDAPIYLMCDGVRPEQEHRREDYHKYKENLITKMLDEKEEKNLYPIFFPEFNHQACMEIRTLFLVKTPLILVMEHDTPLMERPIDWELLSNALMNGATHHTRLHYDEEIHPDHMHMIEEGRDCPNLIRTRQFHHRPSITRTDWYGQLLVNFFSPDSRTFVEDKLHGPISYAPWQDYRLTIYDPFGDGKMMKRSRHTCGREDEAKYEMIF